MNEHRSGAPEEVPKGHEIENVVPLKAPSSGIQQTEPGDQNPLRVETDPDAYPRNQKIEGVARIRLRLQGIWGAAADEELRLLHAKYVSLRVHEQRSKDDATRLILSQQRGKLREIMLSQSYRILAIVLMAAAVILTI